MIFYLVSRSDWEKNDQALVAMPGDDGYIHCCDEGQIMDVCRRYFPVDEDVLAVAFDPTQLPAETRYECGSGGEPERFPHVYGVLRRESVSFVRKP